jgi:hypothetical protein
VWFLVAVRAKRREFSCFLLLGFVHLLQIARGRCDLNLFANRGSEREILITPTAISPLELLGGERISVQELTYLLMSLEACEAL